MRKIRRKNYQSIIKKRIDLGNIINYDELNLKLISNLLNDVISQNTYNTLDLIKLLKDNYEIDFKTTIKKIKDYSKVRFNCCHAVLLLKEKLNEVGIDSKIISYKSIGFSTPLGDRLIKEAHMSLLIPTKRKNKVYYIVLDPGLRIPEPICFFKKSRETLLKIDNDQITVKHSHDMHYPYTMEMKGYNRYSINNVDYQCKEFFDLRYEVVNPLDILFPLSYEILYGYRIINYSKDSKSVATIKVMILDKYIECTNFYNKIHISFDEFRKLKKMELMGILKPYTNKLGIDLEELLDILKFIIYHNEEFVSEVFNKKVLKEYIVNYINK